MKTNSKLTFGVVTLISVLLVTGLIEGDRYGKRTAIVDKLPLLATSSEKNSAGRKDMIQAAMREYRKNLSMFDFSTADAGYAWCDSLGAELDQLIDAAWNASLSGNESALQAAKAKIEGVASF